MDIETDDFYHRLRTKIRAWAQSESGRNYKWVEYVVLAPDLFHLMCRLALDKDVSAADKAMLAVAIAYFVSPIDLIPEGIVGPIGYVDDIALAVYVLNKVVNHTRPEIVRRHWAGDGDVLEVIKTILQKADEMIGTGLWNKLKKMV